METGAIASCCDGWNRPMPSNEGPMTALDGQTERRCRDSFRRQQAMATIGASMLSVASGEVEIAMPFSERLTQQHGFIHAGIITMLCDTACGFAALSLMP